MARGTGVPPVGGEDLTWVHLLRTKFTKWSNMLIRLPQEHSTGECEEPVRVGGQAVAPDGEPRGHRVVHCRPQQPSGVQPALPTILRQPDKHVVKFGSGSWHGFLARHSITITIAWAIWLGWLGSKRVASISPFQG